MRMSDEREKRTMIVDLVDGTYELFRHFYGLRRFTKGKDRPYGAVVGVLNGVLEMIERQATHVGVATDHVIESCRNALWPGYKTGGGIDPALWAQFHPLEDALAAMGVTVWPMVELEADDALASAAHLAAADASPSSASSSIMGQTATPIARSASSRGWNCASSTGSIPAPVLYSGQRSFRNDSITWSVATPRWVPPPSMVSSTVCSTPATAPYGLSLPWLKRRWP